MDRFRTHRRACLLGVAAILLLAGCTPPDITPPSSSVAMVLLEEDHGWVEVRVTGVTTGGYQILWGDVRGSYGVTDILPAEEIYAHFYQAVEGEASGEQIPTEYVIELVGPQGQTVDSTTVLVAVSDCHLELVRLVDRTVTVRYWGRFGIDYSISWGDRFADHVRINMTTATGLETHTYAGPGTYALGMEEIWAPSQIFFEITVE